MSGHSKWNNIKRKKEKTDGAKAKVFTKIGRELAVAVKEGGGPDPVSNSKLKDCIAKAKAANVPNDNIERIIKRAAGDGDENKYENIVYEGYGPCGVAVIVEALSDNRNRTAADVRHDFDKYGGNLGTTGCVSFLFERKGVLVIEREGHEEDKVMEDALEAGAADLQADEDVFEIFTEPDDFSGVLNDLTNKGYEFETAEIQMVPSTYVKVPESKQNSMQKLLDTLEDLDDVQNVWHNWDMSDVEDNEE
ncbi:MULTISPECIES: YebC/PmpR family DNA-binding transcriptional regulator [Caproicibacterium]|jgi:YebC/PmpR family DNA-binding regulatory protein|uniref:Probable transcriptional regulatory protein GJQ69_05100 n=1 Tax=Caproicibacterium lactatifermentans TaxID=2666138 RepID=A0A859DV51_9FIRM|nr:YebC/PmpR family DNA-binding transcriptional regulator [Caproicibacterium lactatifermentans]ARP50366.1 YebC/PmpR family DNA-binding transcriptional regulator [Ruminococcaceae bacterium CPB6]QKN23911.1 YebC/PmpR family DNA-binding transcriptional regulator [Caproicibacterium lactatifermentans]QKO31019.1 YebC/PmpR family DNA-binding transcriptional regulator [Caproicibacterium lactatifermentans]